MFGENITGKFEAGIKGLTAGIEYGGAEFSGGYSDGKISGFFAVNMQETTSEGTEVTASFKFEIEIDLNKYGRFLRNYLKQLEMC